MADKKIIYISGSPCSGKSTMATLLKEEYGGYYFKVDDYLLEYVERGYLDNKEICKSIKNKSPDETWMADPYIQCKEEFEIYDEISEYVLEKLKQIDSDFIITEGAAYTPYVMRKYGIKDYIAIVPTAEFQVSEYKKRPWINNVLKDCSDRKTAFDNWMKRDMLFAQEVKKQCEIDGITCLTNDGKTSINDIYIQVKDLLGL